MPAPAVSSPHTTVAAARSMPRAVQPKASATHASVGIRPSPDPVAKAVQDTAAYTRQLATFTLVLAIATVLSVVASILVQVATTRRDDRLRKSDHLLAEAARREQYEHTEKMRELAVRQENDRRESTRLVNRSQMIEILKAYERYSALLESIPNHPITAVMSTAQTLLARAFSSEIADAVPESDRQDVYFAILKAHETLCAAVEQQAMRDEMFDRLEAEQRAAAAFDNDFAAANELAQKTNKHEDLLRAIQMANSPSAVDAKEFRQTADDRAKKMNAIHPLISKNAKDAMKYLARAKARLGDDSAPHPGLQPRGPLG